MQIVFRVLPLLIAAIFVVSSFRWIIDPATAADSLGMELLSGAGASTQIGDIGAFFVCVAAMVGLAQRRGHSHWFLPAAMLLGAAALMRTLAWVTGNADFAAQLILSEVIMAAILWTAARLRSNEVSDGAA